MQLGRARVYLRSWPRFVRLLLGIFLFFLLFVLAWYQMSLMKRFNQTKTRDQVEIKPATSHADDSGLQLGLQNDEVFRSPLASFINVNLTSVWECKRKLIKAEWNASASPNNLTLVIYHLGSDNKKYSYRVQHDNIQIFFSILNDSLPMFTIVQVLGGRNDNSFMSLLQTHNLSHVCFIDYFQAPYDLSAHIFTLAIIGKQILRRFKSVFLLNHSTRGPLSHRQNGIWLREYNAMLQSNVVLAGAMFNCEIAPHVQTHAFLLRTDVASLIVSHHLKLSRKQLENRGVDYIVHAEIGMSVFLREAGYDIISRSLNLSHGLDRFSPEKCANTSHYPATDSTSQANLIFYKFGGTAADYSCSTPGLGDSEVARLTNYLLPQVVTRLTDELHRSEPGVKLLMANSFCREGPNGESEKPGTLVFSPGNSTKPVIR